MSPNHSTNVQKAESRSPCLDYEEARLIQLEEFAKMSLEQRVEWLADMLELMQMADEDRKPSPPR